MKKKILILVMGLLLIGTNLYAGNLTVNGNVGIGTTTPTANLTVEHPNDGWNGYDPIMNLSAWQSGENTNGGAIDFYVNNTSYYYPTSRIIHTMSTGYGGELQFATTDNFQTTLPTSRLVIKADGNVGIGTTNPGAKLDVNGDIKVPMVTQWCTYGTNPGNPTCDCPSGYYALDCGRNHYNPVTLYSTGTGCYAETSNGYTDANSALVVRCAKIHE